MARSQAIQFVGDGQSRAEEAVRAEFEKDRARLTTELGETYAAEFATTGWLGRLRLRLHIRRKIGALLEAELARVASPYSLY
jgi:hypothetical protein